ncbi:hypothetical protein D3C85_1086160 [compost metagenome]
MKIPLSSFSLYSADELMNYLENGLIHIPNETTEEDLLGFVRKVMENTVSKEDYERDCETAYNDGYKEGNYYAEVE